MTKKTPRFLVAKYIPDLRRQEPRNIGVIVWTPTAVAHRFLGHPKFVHERGTYRDWTLFWSATLERPTIQRSRRGAVAKSSDEYLDALLETGRDNYVLSDGGYLLDELPEGQLSDLADYLFESIVADEQQSEAEKHAGLHRACAELIKETGLDSNPHFQKDRPVVVQLAPDAPEELSFSYGYGNGKPVRLYQRVNLPSQKNRLVQSRHHAAWMFKHVVEQRILPKDHCASLVFVGSEDEGNALIADSLRILRLVARVLNLADPASRGLAKAEFSELQSISLNDAHG